MHKFCILCGVQLAPFPRLNPGTSLNRLDWQYEVRAICSESDRLSPALTGVGYLDSSCVLAPSDSNGSYMDMQHDLDRHHLHYSPPTEPWIFAFHDACWQILLDKISLSLNVGVDPQRIAELLFDHLYCLPYDRFYVSYPYHDFGGALKFWKSPVNLPDEWRFLLADPGTVELGSFSPSTLPAAKPPHAPKQDFPSFQCFYKLSREIIHLLVTSLASPDLCNLRLSSKFIAGLTDPDALPQSFWKSRFAVDREMGFLPPEKECCLASGSRPDWRKVYFNVKHSLRDRTGSGHISNRRRIWRCLDQLTCSFIPIVDQSLCLQDQQSIELELSSQGYRATQFVSGPVVPDGRNRLGIRSFGSQSFMFRSQSLKTGLELSISRIVFDSTEYICGLRISKPCHVNVRTEVSRVGYIVPQSEVHISVPPQYHFSGIRVATSASGIVGLVFNLEDKIGQVTQTSVGRVTDLPEGVGITTLEPRIGFQLSGVVIGLDACKFVSLQLLEPMVDSATLDDNSIDMTTTGPWLWHPNQPETSGHGVILPSIPEQSKTIEPTFVLKMDFGGPKGILLPCLNRITALHDDGGGSFRGFAFSYIDGRRMSFGMRKIVNIAGDYWSCIEQTFSIDGPGGERIVSIEFESTEAPVGNHIRAIKFTTSHGRILDFPRTKQSSSVRLHKSPRLLPPVATTISAILAKVEMSSGALQSLGLHYTTTSAASPSSSLGFSTEHNSEVLRPHSFPNDHEKWIKAPRSLHNSNGCFTSVILSNIKRVGLSAGIPGYTRGVGHISGLCFEFWDSNTCIYVGQWFCEVEQLEFKRGERISSLTFWQSQESNPKNSQRENSGRITGIKITTTGDGRNAAEICFGDKHEMLSYSFTDNPYEELTGLAWTFNHEFDYMYTLTRPSNHYPNTFLVLHNLMDFWPNSRMPSKLFWRVQDGAGSWFTVSRIHAFFRRDSLKLAGFIFEYRDNQVRKHAGHFDGVKTSMSLRSGEYITRMDVLKAFDDDEDEVVFYTSTGQIYALSAFGLSNQPRYQNPSHFESFQFSDLHVPERASSQASAVSQSHSSKISDECVGIWLTMKIYPRVTNTVEAVGPILTRRGHGEMV